MTIFTDFVNDNDFFAFISRGDSLTMLWGSLREYIPNITTPKRASDDTLIFEEKGFEFRIRALENYLVSYSLKKGEKFIYNSSFSKAEDLFGNLPNDVISYLRKIVFNDSPITKCTGYTIVNSNKGVWVEGYSTLAEVNEELSDLSDSGVDMSYVLVFKGCPMKINLEKRYFVKEDL